MALLTDSTTLVLNEPALQPALPSAVNTEIGPVVLLAPTWAPVHPGNDPTDPANWRPNHVPESGQDVYIPGGVMQLHGTTLDGTKLHLGTDGTDGPVDPAILEVFGGSNLDIALVLAPGQGNPMRIDAFDRSTIALKANGGSNQVNPPHTQLDINVAPDSVLTGHFDIRGEINVFINASGPGSVYDHDGISFLNAADFVKIIPDMIGTGTTHMNFALLELGGAVAPTQTFDVANGSLIYVDHADKFKGVLNFAEGGNPAEVVLKDFTIKTDSLVGNQFSCTSTDGRSAAFTINYNPQNTALSVQDSPGGVSIIIAQSI